MVCGADPGRCVCGENARRVSDAETESERWREQSAVSADPATPDP